MFLGYKVYLIMSQSTKRIRVAISGCGKISSNHINAITNLERYFNLVAVCDVNSSNLEKITSKLNVNGYIDFNEMLIKEAIDLVVICTPSGLHPIQTISAAKQGIHVLTEKPMAIAIEDGQRMVAECKNHNVKLFVVKQNRLHPTMQLLKQAIVDNRFGKIFLAQVNVFWTRPQSYYDDDGGWRGTKIMDGGALMNQASHYIDLLYWMLGPVNFVSAFSKTHRAIEMEDTAVLNLEHESGAISGLSVTMLTFPKNLEASITILGETGSVKIGGTSVNEIIEWSFKDSMEYDQKIGNTNLNTSDKSSPGHERYYLNVANVFNESEIPISDGAEGLKSLEILSAVYRSINSRAVERV